MNTWMNLLCFKSSFSISISLIIFPLSQERHWENRSLKCLPMADKKNQPTIQDTFSREPSLWCLWWTTSLAFIWRWSQIKLSSKSLRQSFSNPLIFFSWKFKPTRSIKVTEKHRSTFYHLYWDKNTLWTNWKDLQIPVLPEGIIIK